MDPKPAQAVETALGAISIAMRPAELAGLILVEAKSLLKATMAASTCEELSRSIWHTALDRVPIACELLHLAALFPGMLGAVQMTAALLSGFKSICDGLHMYTAVVEAATFLRHSRAHRWVLRCVGRLKHCLRHAHSIVHRSVRDMTAGKHMLLAGMLRDMQSTQQAQRTAELMHELREQVRDVRSALTADKQRMKAEARAARARRTPGGQVVRVSRDGVHSVTVLGQGSTFAASVPVHNISACEQVTRNAGVTIWGAPTGGRLQQLSMYHGRGAVAWSPDGSRVVMQRSLGSCSQECRSVEVWDSVAGVPWIELVGHTARVTSAAWSPDGAMVATGAADCTAAVWDARSGDRMHELRGHSKAVSVVAWSPDGARVATGSADGTVAVWDVATGACICQLRGHGSAVLSIVWSPNGCAIATRSAHSTLALWNCNVATGLFVREHVLQNMQSVAWSPDGSTVVTVSTGGTAAVRDAVGWACMHELCGHSGAVTKAVWSPDASRVATVLEDKTAAVWDVCSGDRMHVLSGHRKEVTSVAWSPDGGTVYTSSLDGTVRIYGLASRVQSSSQSL